MTNYNINKCFGIKTHVAAPVNQPMAALADLALSNIDIVLKNIDGITTEEYLIEVDSSNITVHVIKPADAKKGAPCIIDIHGGGFIFDASPHMYELAARYAKETKAVVVFPRYRLTRRNPYPTQINDCRAVYDWVKSSSELLSINKNKIAIMGDSAGGYLVAMTTVYAANKGDSLLFQLLIYPVTDPTMGTESMKKYVDTPVWNAKNNKSMWKLYYRKQEIDLESQSLLYMPLPENIPDTYVETAEFDCLHDEGLLYAKRLKDLGINVKINETKETMHGFDEVKCDITEMAVKERIEFIRQMI